MITKKSILQELSSYDIITGARKRVSDNCKKLSSPKTIFNRFQKKCMQLLDAYQMTDAELEQLDNLLKKTNGAEKICPLKPIANESYITRFITGLFETSIGGGAKMNYYLPTLESALEELNQKCCAIIFKTRCNTRENHVKFPATKKETEQRFFCMGPGN